MTLAQLASLFGMSRLAASPIFLRGSSKEVFMRPPRVWSNLIATCCNDAKRREKASHLRQTQCINYAQYPARFFHFLQRGYRVKLREYPEEATGQSPCLTLLYDPSLSGGVWILSIVHHRGIDQLRSTARRRQIVDRVEATTPTSQLSEAFSETWRNSQREQVRKALRVLPPEQLKVLELTYFSGYTHKEIAELLDLPLGTVKGRMRLGLKKIREYFDSRGLAVPG